MKRLVILTFLLGMFISVSAQKNYVYVLCANQFSNIGAVTVYVSGNVGDDVKEEYTPKDFNLSKKSFGYVLLGAVLNHLGELGYQVEQMNTPYEKAVAVILSRPTKSKSAALVNASNGAEGAE